MSYTRKCLHIALFALIFDFNIQMLTCISQNGFTAPDKIRKDESFELKCDYRLDPNERLESVILSKDSEEFYRYTKSKHIEINSVRGVNRNDVEKFSENAGRVRIKHVNRETEGLYSCQIIVEMMGTKSSSTNSKYIAFVNGERPFDKHFDKQPNMSSHIYVDLILLAICSMFTLF